MIIFIIASVLLLATAPSDYKVDTKPNYDRIYEAGANRR